MIISTNVELKINKKILNEASAILENAGLTLSAALRLTLEEVVRAGYFYLAPPTDYEGLVDEMEFDDRRYSNEIYSGASLEDLLNTFKDSQKKK